MGIMNWLRPPPDAQWAHTASQDADSGTTTHGSEIAGLDFKSAIDAHMRWKVRLEAYISGTSTEQLNADTICQDDQCPLGKWIHARGSAEFGYSETFFDMKAHHAHFHRCAGEVVRKAQIGDKETALRLLHQGDYVRASERVKKLLAKLFVLVADGQTAIDAHVKWKERLLEHLSGNADQPLDADTVSRDDQCSLGAWIHGEGSVHFSGSTTFEQLREVHARFHATAGTIVRMANNGQREQALALVQEGAYAAASDDITLALVELFKKPQ